MMDKKEILKKVGGILAELSEQYEYLSREPDNLSELELELFAANANFLSDHVNILIKLSSSIPKNINSAKSDLQAIIPKPENTLQPEPKTELKKDYRAIEEPVRGTHKDDEVELTEPEEPKIEDKSISDWTFELEKEPALTFEFEEKQMDKLFDRPLTEAEKQVIEEKTKLKIATPEQEESKESEKVKEAQETSVQAPVVENEGEDIYVKEVVISERTIAVPVTPETTVAETPALTVNDLLSQKTHQETLGSQFNSKQVKDLKGMISLNDKLLFIRDLFNGYSLAYSEAIELLNRFDSFEAADNFLKQNYASKNHWSDKQDVADKFYQVLNRRFS